MTDSEKRRYTIEDILNLPEGVRAELVDGKLYNKESPGWKHQWLVGQIFTVICKYVTQHAGAGRAFVGPVSVYLNGDDSTYLEPDVFVVSDLGKLEDRGYVGAPDWVIEVISPDSITMDYVTKQYEYMMAGVREYWIVDLRTERVVVVGVEEPRIQVYSFQEKVPSRVLEGVSIDFPLLLRFL